MRVKVEFTSSEDVREFTEIVKGVVEDVRLVGKDEHGCDWSLSAKSFFCSLLIEAKLQRKREHTAHDVDWNTIYCECDKDIFVLIKKFVV